MSSAFTGIYTLTPLHIGTGQANGAVDLPIARERHTELPLIPATSLKGVARDRCRRLASNDEKRTERLFGSEPPARLSPNQPGVEAGEGGAAVSSVETKLKAGSLVFHDAMLLAYPCRSLHRPFMYVTCPFVLTRFARLLRAVGGVDNMPPVPPAPCISDAEDANVRPKIIVLEDVDYAAADVPRKAEARAVGVWLGKLLPKEEAATRQRLERDLIVVQDEVFIDLLRRAPPVSARVQLTEGKTTDEWVPDDGRPTQNGNLWYEETIPSDALFGAVITTRSGLSRDDGADLKTLREVLASLPAHQLGGNETVGHGLCWWVSA